MWLLTCDGDLLEGKRIWLRPGVTHVLGRTSGRVEGGERVQYIGDKSVSRKHLTIQVSTVNEGDSGRLFIRSKIQVTDGSKLGTTLNGQRFLQETKTLDGKEYTIKLGSYEPLFHLFWHPVTISFTSTSKKVKQESLSGPRKDALERADVKIITDYVVNETTHAVAKKRNTPPALHALIQGRWLVTENFVEALFAAVHCDKQEVALLERDFDAHWPSEERCFVPAGGEPNPRENSFLKPNLDRAEVFHDYVFVFLSQSQHDQLSPVINAGKGKTLLHEVDSENDSVGDVVDFVKSVAGRKGSAQFKLSQQIGDGGVVVVRWHERDERDRDFMRKIDLALDQRSIEQNEFLDAILTVNASGLRRQLEERPSYGDLSSSVPTSQIELESQQRPQQQERTKPVARPPPPDEISQRRSREQGRAASPPRNHEDQSASNRPPEPEPSPAVKRRNRRIITQSRFQGFDDFDPSQFSRAPSGSPAPSVAEDGPSQRSNSQSMDIDEDRPTTQSNARKRPFPDQQAEDQEDMYASILPNHAAMKHRRLEAAQNGEADPYAQAVNEVESRTRTAVGTAPRSKKKQKEMDVMAEVQARRKEQDEQRRLDEESLQQAMEGVDIKELRDLAQIEEMEIPDRPQPQRMNGENDSSERWDPAWNGRKNFKKFRRQGESNDGPQLRRVIVTLEEAPRKGQGLGDEYWLEPSSAPAARHGHISQSQSQSARHSQHRNNKDDNDGDDEASRFRRRLQISREEDEETALVEEVTADQIAGSQPRSAAVRNAVNATPSQTMRSLSTQRSTNAAGKRPAAQQGGGPAKRVRQSTLGASVRSAINVDDEDDDDGLKFRRRR